MPITSETIDTAGLDLARATADLISAASKPSGLLSLSTTELSTYSGDADVFLTQDGAVYRLITSTEPVDGIRYLSVLDQPNKRYWLMGFVESGREYPIAAFRRAGSDWQDALFRAIDSPETSFVLPVGTIPLEETILVSTREAFRLRGLSRAGSTLSKNTPGPILQLNANNNARVENLRLMGFRTNPGDLLPDGLISADNRHFYAEGLTLDSLRYGARFTADPLNELPKSNRITGCLIRNSEGVGISVEASAEYMTVSGNDIYGTKNLTGITGTGGGAGIYVSAGNVRVSDNTVCENQQGIVVQGNAIGAGNPDHGGLYNNTVNHNDVVGVALLDVFYSEAVVSNNIWATIGPNGINQDYRGTGTTPGLYIENCRNLNVTANVIAHNRLNVGIKGMTTSILNNTLRANPDYTAYHIREFTGAQNAQNTIHCTTQGSLKNGAKATYVPLTDTQNIRTEFRQFSGLDDTIVVLQTGDAAYTHVGNAAHVKVKTGYVPAVTLPPLWRGQSTTIEVEQLTAGASVLVAVTGAVLTSRTALCKVSGSTATLTGSGLYTFTQDLNGNCRITSDAVRELVRPVTSFLNGWGQYGGLHPVGFYLDSAGRVNLEGIMVGGTSYTTAFVLPVGYRPSVIRFKAINRGEKFGAIHVTPEGEVVVKAIDPGDWISLEGVFIQL